MEYHHGVPRLKIGAPGDVNRNAFTLAAYLGHTNVLAAVVRMGATCSWDDQGTCIAFHTAIRHNRHDVVRCLCTPKASGGCGLALDLLRRSQRDTVWRTLTDDIGRHQYQMIWLGPNFDPEELRYEGSHGRRRIRSGYVWQQVREMIRLLAACGMPAHKFLPRVSADKIEEIKACTNSRLDPSDMSREERREVQALASSAGEYNGQFENEDEMLDIGQFLVWLQGLWPSGTPMTYAAADGAKSESESEGEGEDDEGEDDLDSDESLDEGF